MLAGAVSGAAVGGITGGLYGGWEGALQGAKYGAIGGAIMGPVSMMYQVNCVRCLEDAGVNGAARYGYSLERVAVQSVAGGISSAAQGRSFMDGLRSSFVPSALTYMAVSMRASMWDQSLKDARNSSGTSVGLMGDGHKLGGGRWDESNPEGISPLGGRQGDIGFLGVRWNDKTLAGDFYSPASWQDYLVEAYAGTHDWLNSGYWYDAMGNALDRQGSTRFFGEIMNGLNVVPASVFVGGSVVQPYNYSAVFGGGR
jgi:hypothetical protein